jgi:TfoX/Sxy family transcriptional regulator of competence genes
MAYDEDLADRVREALPGDAPIDERKMFGGLAFLLNGNMVCGVVKDTLMLRLGPAGADRALSQAHVRAMDFTGRPMKGMVFVDPPGLHGGGLQHWVDEASRFVRELPAKPRK